MMTTTERDWERLLYPRSLDDLRGRYGKETDMASDTIALRRAIAEEREVKLLLGPFAELARQSFEALGVKSFAQYADAVYGGVDQLREQRFEEGIRLSRERRSSGDRRQTALEMADKLGVPRDAVEAELEREEREGL